VEDSPTWEKSFERHQNPEKQLQQVELSDILQEALMELNEEQREVVIMKEYEGLKFREIAEVLNISENTAKSRMYYGLDGLKKILERKKKCDNICKECLVLLKCVQLQNFKVLQFIIHVALKFNLWKIQV
jgi:RNA polymerase sigma-70 factor (ECF subfamily)